MHPQEILKISISGSVVEFCDMLSKVNYKLPEYVQHVLYELKRYEKLEILFSFSPPHFSLQEKMLLDKNVRVIDYFSKNWSFHQYLHKKILISDIRVFSLAIRSTKFSVKTENKMAKSAEKNKIKLYRKYHNLSKKAFNIVKDVRAINLGA